MVKELLLRGANTEVRGEFPLIPLFQAAEAGRHKIMRLLVRHGADIKVTNEYKAGLFLSSPLLSAVRKGHLEVVKVLAQHGANIEARDPSHSSHRDTPLFTATRAGHLKIAKVLI